MTLNTDPLKLIMSTDASSLKILIEGSGTFTVPGLSGAGVQTATATIPHNFGSDGLIYQILVKVDNANGRMIPWESNDGRLVIWGALDSTNLYIFAENSDSSGFGTPAHPVGYTYRVLIP